jgi:hypothetical protein
MRGVTQVSEHTFEIGGMGDAPLMTVTAPLAPAPVVPQPIIVSAQRPVDEFDHAAPLSAAKMLAQMKARLRVVKREIAAAKKLERERDQLQRLIRAANTELDNVRRLRAAG